MAKISNVNIYTATGAEAIFSLKENLKNAGWTVPSSSDGTTYNSSGDQISTDSSGAGGMANTNAWFRIREPGGRREFTFQRTTTNLIWRMKYSALARFTGGSPGATQTPSATDEGVFVGAGSDASPTGTTIFIADGTYKYHCIAQDSPVNGVYGFWAFATTNGSGVVHHFINLEPLMTSSYDLEDPDPAIVTQIFATGGAVSLTNYFSSTVSTGVWGWYRYGGNLSSFLNFAPGGPVTNIGSLVAVLGNYGHNPHSGGEQTFPIGFIRPLSFISVRNIYKGLANFIKGKGVLKLYPETINLANDAYIYIGDILVPWPDGTTPEV